MKNPYAEQTKLKSEALVLEYAPLVKHIANRLAARLPPGFQRDDLIQTGMIGLLEAAEKYDPKIGSSFKTFSEYRIRGAMLDDLRSRDWIPRSVRDNCTKLEAAYVQLRANSIDYPDDAQLAEELDIKPKELPVFLNKARAIPVLSLDNLAVNKDNEELDIQETLSDPDEKDPIEKLLGSEAQEQVVKALEKLPEKEKLVLALYFNEELNLKEIGAVLDISESRASQIRTKAIAQLRSFMREFIDS